MPSPLIPYDYSEDQTLVGWIIHQRQKFKKGLLDHEKINSLNSIRFIWKPTQTWNERFLDLVKFKQQFGHCNVPKSFSDILGLSAWVVDQRKKYNKNTLPSNKIELLNSIGFQWKLRS